MENVKWKKEGATTNWYVSKALTCQCPKNISDMFKLSNSVTTVRYELN
jgi:hypothetical protein